MRWPKAVGGSPRPRPVGDTYHRDDSPPTAEVLQKIEPEKLWVPAPSKRDGQEGSLLPQTKVDVEIMGLARDVLDLQMFPWTNVAELNRAAFTWFLTTVIGQRDEVPGKVARGIKDYNNTLRELRRNKKHENAASIMELSADLIRMRLSFNAVESAAREWLRMERRLIRHYKGSEDVRDVALRRWESRLDVKAAREYAMENRTALTKAITKEKDWYAMDNDDDNEEE